MLHPLIAALGSWSLRGKSLIIFRSYHDCAALSGKAGLGLAMFDIVRHVIHDKYTSRFANATGVMVVLEAIESCHQKGSAKHYIQHSIHI